MIPVTVLLMYARLLMKKTRLRACEAARVFKSKTTDITLETYTETAGSYVCDITVDQFAGGVAGFVNRPELRTLELRGKRHQSRKLSRKLTK